MSELVVTFENDKAIEDLRRGTNRGTKSEVVRDSLALYRALFDYVKQGKKIYIGSHPDNIIELQISTFK